MGAVMIQGKRVGIYPVMHKEASKEYSYVYEGKTYYFCCPMCIDEFKKDPEKYIKKIEEELEKEAKRSEEESVQSHHIHEGQQH